MDEFSFQYFLMPETSKTDDGNGWSIDGHNILASERLEMIRRLLEDKGPVIVEHWFYYGSSAPDRIVFDDFEKLEEYLKTMSRPGDAFHIWDFAELCRNDNTIAYGKYPDAEGRTPAGGSY